MRIGIDFDNTIIDYSDIFTKQAFSLGWIKTNSKKTKQQVCDLIRALPDGEMKWKKLQGLAYGKFINEAKPFEGVIKFIKRCRQEEIEVFVVSHKTEYPEILEEKINLRESAFRWLNSAGFFNLEELCLDQNKIFFEHPRERKIHKIVELQCTHFIDDLEDVFKEPQFPRDIMKILFSPDGRNASQESWNVCRHWNEIEELVFRHECSHK